ncbi:hypothetical protein QVD17_17618 [Tagetes erecta]|uniref:Uncharacterized protein n=1 Tax=Tagetes erecta TaxID=13708 RepID=A0AAD8P0F1_TARER|nr:hypothetical protein QVD17_17618 [Tagetes erecta]
MASISTCLTITPNYSYTKPSSIISLKPSRQLHFSYKAHNHIFSTNVSSVAAMATVRPTGIIESDKFPAEVMNRVTNVVDKCGRRVTLRDTASITGIKLIVTERALQALVIDTNAFIEINKLVKVAYGTTLIGSFLFLVLL